MTTYKIIVNVVEDDGGDEINITATTDSKETARKLLFDQADALGSAESTLCWCGDHSDHE